MAKFDLEKYWAFRVWVKSQIAQLRALLSEYQQNGGGGGTGGGGDFDPNGSYPNMSVGNATKATSAATADRATKATTADKATIADKATTADYATTAGQATTAESAKTATNADRATTAGYATTAGVAESTEHAATADFATDLTGRIEATPEVFTYRSSAGEQSIKDDNAFIRSIKGNSVVWNQLVKNALDQSGNNGWWSRQGANNVELNGSSIKLTLVSGTSIQPQITQKANFVLLHKYLVSCEIKSSASKTITCYLRESSNLYGESVKSILWMPTDGQYQTIYTSTGGYPYVTIIVMDQVNDVGDSVTVSDIQLIDLTAMFGTGNEPTTVEEFRALYPNSYYPYNAGELRNLVCSGIKTVGFNQWDGKAIVGYISDGTGAHSPNANHKCTDYIRIIPTEQYYVYTPNSGAQWAAWYDENKTFIQGIIGYGLLTPPSNARYARFTIYYSGYTTDWATFCVNLHHTGYRDGEYEPYKEVTHALPLSQITNGEPLRKAGGEVYDEINETEYIRRVGVRGYATGDKDDATLLTDGRYTNYPLDEPIVTPIETPIDFNYYVEDFGTEEAILAENSAPFSADIIYQFNATDQVRNNTRNIQRLKKTAFNPSGSTTQYIRGDGSYADVSELSRVIPINGGEGEVIDNEDGGQNLQFTLFPQYYAKSVYTANADSYKEVIIRVEAPDNTDFVAEYWLELEIGESIPDLTFENPDNVRASFRFNGEIRTDAVNIYHIITTDGGMRYFGEIKNYVF